LHFQLAAIRAFVAGGGQDKSSFAPIHQPGYCKFYFAHLRVLLQGWVIVENGWIAAINAKRLIVEIVKDLKFIAMAADGRCKTVVIEIR
jgi:hypothetical protein